MKVLFRNLIAIALMVAFPMIAPAAADEVNQEADYGFRFSLPDRWSVDYSGYLAEEFGGAYELVLTDDQNVATIMFVASKPGAMGYRDIREWALNEVLDHEKGGILLYDFYSEGYGFSTPPSWSEGSAATASAHEMIVLTTPAVKINGNARRIMAGYLATKNGWYVMLVANQKREKPLEDAWNEILAGTFFVGRQVASQ